MRVREEERNAEERREQQSCSAHTTMVLQLIVLVLAASACPSAQAARATHAAGAATIAGAAKASREAARTSAKALPVDGDGWRPPRPSPEDHAAMARWLVASTSWGTLSTLDKASQTPNGGVKSHSDWVGHEATGRVFLFLSPMDVSTQDLLVDARTSYTVSEAQLSADGPLDLRGRQAATAAARRAREAAPSLTRGTLCHGVDPEDPTCAKVSLVGVTLPVPEAEADVALAALFARHPAMADWPAGHRFAPFELHVKEAHLLDWYGGMKVISGEEYYSVEAHRLRLDPAVS